ncbi:MAG: GtrA family protein [Clostridia bacterium]|nr:GtrA family protein [Clostridia bacterium]
MGFLRRHRKFIMYILCGVLATLINSGTYWLFNDIVFKNVDMSSNLYNVISTVIAWVLSVIVAFVTNKVLVFKSKSFRPMVLFSEGTSFILARLLTFLLDAGFMALFVQINLLDFAGGQHILKIASTLIVTLVNYFVSEFLVFRKKHVHHFARILMAEGVEYYACIPLSKCKITKPYLLYKNGIDKNANVIVMLFPYRTRVKAENLTAYASVKDYHAYVESLSDKLEKYIFRKHPTAQFKVFTDHSPIDEVHAACVSGLGFIGDNGLLINEKYSSFVFVGECITSLTPKQLGLAFADEEEMRTCLHCGLCKRACPAGCIDSDENGKDTSNKGVCLSAITQKKGELSSEEVELMLKNGSIWGCDVCQNVCPYTKNAKYTPIKYFIDSAITRLDMETLSSMSSEEFNSRPFAWRGPDTIKRNVIFWEEAKLKREKEEAERLLKEEEEKARRLEDELSKGEASSEANGEECQAEVLPSELEVTDEP